MIRTTAACSALLLLAGAAGAATAERYPVTPKAVGSNRFELEVDGQPLFVHKFKDIHYAHFPHPEPGGGHIEGNVRRPFRTAEVSPKSAGLALTVDPASQSFEFRIGAPGKWVVTLDGRERLFIFSEKPLPASPNGTSILDFGADPSGKTLSTKAIQDAINSAAPASTVRIPAGHYLSGSVALKSDITLLLEAGALLQASPNPDDFEPDQSAFIVIEKAENVALMGRGTIDGSGAFLRHLTDQSGRLLAIRDSRNVTVEGVILRDPRAWNTHLIRSEHVTLRNVKLLNDRNVSNTDGIDPDSSRHVLIEDAFFYCGDDAVAIKSTNRDGRFEDVFDIVVRHNLILTEKSALKVGTETHAAEMRDITFAHNDVIECDRGMSIYARDGAHVHAVRFIGNRFERNYPDYQQCLIDCEIKKRSGLSRVSDILIQDCTVDEGWPRPSMIRGFSPDHGISDVRFVNYRYAGKLCASAAEADLEIGRHARDISFETIAAKADENEVHRFAPVRSSRVRLQIDQSIPEPAISEFMVHREDPARKGEEQTGNRDGPPPPARDADLPNVLLYGDSITGHYFPHVEEALEGKVNLYQMPSHPDWDSSTFIPYMRELKSTMGAAWHWDVIHFNFGLHDMKRYNAAGKKDRENGTAQVNEEDYARNLEANIEWMLANAPGARLIFATTTPVPEGEPRRRSSDSTRYNDIARGVLARHPEVSVNDLYAFTLPHHEDWKQGPHDVHYKKVGRKAQREQVAAAILETIRAAD